MVKNRRLIVLWTVLSMLALMMALPLPAVLGEGQAGTTLTADLSIGATWTRTFGWTIEKTVTPAVVNLFQGDTGQVKYTLTVVKDGGTDAAYLSGVVQVDNGGERATEGLAIVVEVTMPPSDVVIASAGVDVSGNPVLDPGETGYYPYQVAIPTASIEPGATYKVTAHVTITNHSGSLGTPKGPSPSATTVLPDLPTLINDQITVKDITFGHWGSISETSTKSYCWVYDCGDAGINKNTAVILETGQEASAYVTVNCHALQVAKTAETSFTRTYHWTLDKSADQTELVLAGGEQISVTYTIIAGATYVDSNWAVQGVISVTNPAPIPATINSVADVVSGVGAASVSCGVSFPYNLAAGQTLICSYSAALPDGATRTNTATATLQNHLYDFPDNEVTPSGTTDFVGTAPVSFANATITEVDKCADLWDSYAGDLGEICYSDVPKTFTYSRPIGPYNVCGVYTVDNIAELRTLDVADSVSIYVNVPCGGCTLTPGYWKTHSSYGPAPYDDTWVPIGEEGTPFFLSGKSWYQVLWTPPAGGNAYYILAHQYIAARLNQLNGAWVPTEVQGWMNAATELFEAYEPTGRLDKEEKAEFIFLAGKLDAYNNGLIGPGHCDE